MSQSNFDCVLVQSHLSMDEEISIYDLAQQVFCEEGKMPGKVALARAQQAAQKLVMMKMAIPIYMVLPSNTTALRKNELTHIRSKIDSSLRLSALMYLTVRRSILGRKTDQNGTPLEQNLLDVEHIVQHLKQFFNVKMIM